MDLTEAEDIMNRQQEYTEELYKKDLNDLDNHDGVITDLEPDILECEAKWVLGSTAANKASGRDGIPEEQFKILNNDAQMVQILAFYALHSFVRNTPLANTCHALSAEFVHCLLVYFVLPALL